MHLYSGSFRAHAKFFLVLSEETAHFYEQKKLTEDVVHSLNDVVLGLTPKTVNISTGL